MDDDFPKGLKISNEIKNSPRYGGYFLFCYFVVVFTDAGEEIFVLEI